MDNTPVENDAQVSGALCRVCAHPIPTGAKKCTQCDEFQSTFWRVLAGFDLKGLLALIPMLALVYSYLADRIQPQRADLQLYPIACSQFAVDVFGSNAGNRAAALTGASYSLPDYAPPGTCGQLDAPCDFRTRNFERWTIDRGAGPLSVDLPRRMFSVSAISMAPEVVAEFREAAGLPMYSSRSGGELIGRTRDSLLFQEFNRGLPGAPTRLTSGGITGWVRLPQLRADGRATEFAETVGGIVQVLRGDWDGAARNLENVIENPATRAPLRLDALLLLGMARERGGDSGQDAFARALEQAPYDHRAVRYAVMGYLAGGNPSDAAEALDLLLKKSQLFAPNDSWFLLARQTAEALAR